MPFEIERKFLVKDPSILEFKRGDIIVQGYLSLDPNRTVRVRTIRDKGYITIKGKKVGMTCPEFEYEIPHDHAMSLFDVVVGSLVVKERFKYHDGIHSWDVDRYMLQYEGLYTAEIELKAETDPVALPSWVGAEVTQDMWYANSSLARYACLLSIADGQLVVNTELLCF